jgi:ribonuclease HI
VIEIFTDGSAKGNPGPGGYGILLRSGKHYKELSQGFRLTTNNRMELLAVIVALESLKTSKLEVKITTDSKYVIEPINKGWLWNWQKTGFKKKKNVDLWQRFIPLYKTYNPKLHWIKGHAGHPENERCDELAVNAADSATLLVDQGYEASIS